MAITARTGLTGVGGVTVAALTLVAVSVFPIGRAPAASDEDQVRAVLDGMNGSYNRSDFAAFASHVCADMLHANGYETGWYQSRAADGPTDITVNSVDVSGDDAVANVRFVAAKREDARTLDIDFLREGAEWKACRYRATQPV